ncbi:MAG: hypothetical protein L3K23_05730 [Thermoplasmata archaeon]|nr:hypothetical protein [Thermoplasmata archaeon]
MRGFSPAAVAHAAPVAIGLLLLPALFLAVAGGGPIAELVGLPLVAAGVPLLTAGLRRPPLGVAFLAPVAALGGGVGLGSPGPALELAAVVDAVAILAWLAIASHPGRRLADLASGLVTPAFGGGLALGISFLAPSGFAFVGAAATLAGFGFIVTALILWLLTRPGEPAPAS